MRGRVHFGRPLWLRPDVLVMRVSFGTMVPKEGQSKSTRMSPVAEGTTTTETKEAAGRPRFLQGEDLGTTNTADNSNATTSCPTTCVCECVSAEGDEKGSSSSSSNCKGYDDINDDFRIRTVTLNLVALEARNIFSIVEESARDFEAYKARQAEEAITRSRQQQQLPKEPLPLKVQINVEASVDMSSMYNDIINDAKSGGGIFDGYFTNPVILGTVSTLNKPGLLDLTPYVDGTDNFASEIDLDWTDILLPFRQYVAQFEGKIYMLPLDGDIHSMYVREDVLNHFGLSIPRTWNEYNEVARSLHGQIFNNITLSGSCVSRVKGSHGQYWSHLILASITQTDGTSTGSLFDTKDMTPLTGEAFTETLRILEEQALYGVPTEFDDLNLHEVHSQHMNDGSCALTYSWGDTYKLHRAEGSVIGPGELGVYPTPGSTKVLDRDTMTLVPCTKERCKYGTYYEDIGWVNRSPYLANGGWSGCVSANAEPEKQKLAAEFFLFACSKAQAQKGVIPNSTTPWEQLNSQDPFRKSQLEVDKWVRQGYDADSAKAYQVTINQGTHSKNLAVDLRTPTATEVMDVLDKIVHDHLVDYLNGGIQDIDLQRSRERVTESLTERWTDIVKAYDSRGDTEVPILEVYQRLRDVYVPNEELNQLTKVAPVGWTLMGLIFCASLACLTWVYLNRNDRVVKASQPVFLSLIGVGTMVMASSVLTMGIDDGIASPSMCNVACMTSPWLAATGLILVFSALFAKIWRLHTVFENAMRFQRIEVKAKDVLLPLVVMLSLNFVFLIVWTVVDPMYFERVYTGRTGSGKMSSYGQCTSDGVVSKAMLSLIFGVNMIAIVLANFQAYQTRKISTEYSESKWVAFAMISILQAMMIGAPILILASTNPTTNFIVWSMLVFVICMSILGLLFVPKFVSQKKLNSPETRTTQTTPQFNNSYAPATGFNNSYAISGFPASGFNNSYAVPGFNNSYSVQPSQNYNYANSNNRTILSRTSTDSIDPVGRFGDPTDVVTPHRGDDGRAKEGGASKRTSSHKEDLIDAMIAEDAAEESQNRQS